MKLLKYLSVFVFVLFLSANVMAQEEEEMSSEEWENELQRLNERKTELQNQVNQLQSDVENLQSQLDELQATEDCTNELYAMVGATKSDVDDFRNKLNKVMSRVDRKEGPKEEVQNMLNELKKNKISALPEFFDKVHTQAQRSLDAWQEKPQVATYNVVKGDYLWKIAKKDQFYGNGFAWPIIYNANRDQIKNPDLIYPNQSFQVPPLTDQEQQKYEKMRRNYKPAPAQQN